MHCLLRLCVKSCFHPPEYNCTAAAIRNYWHQPVKVLHVHMVWQCSCIMHLGVSLSILTLHSLTAPGVSSTYTTGVIRRVLECTPGFDPWSSAPPPLLVCSSLSINVHISDDAFGIISEIHPFVALGSKFTAEASSFVWLGSSKIATRCAVLTGKYWFNLFTQAAANADCLVCGLSNKSILLQISKLN